MSQKSTFRAWRENFGDAGLFGDDDRDVVAHRLERGDAERLADAGHDVKVGHLEDFFDVAAAEEAGEQDLVADAHCRGHLDGAADHVAGAGHDELHVVHHLQHFLGRGQEIFRAFLHGDAAEEQDDFFVLVDVVLLGVEPLPLDSMAL